METKNEWCEWLGHKDKSVGPQDHLYDSQNEGFICKRCDHTHNVNAQPLLARQRKGRVIPPSNRRIIS
jgi:hypothetical protein